MNFKDFFKNRQKPPSNILPNNEDYEDKKQNNPVQTSWDIAAIKAFKTRSTNADTRYLYPKGDHDFGWWYGYFIEQAGSGWSKQSLETIDNLIVAIFGIPNSSNINAQVNTVSITTPNVPISDQQKLEILRKVMRIGFVDYNSITNGIRNINELRTVLQNQNDKYNRFKKWRLITNVFPVFYKVNSYKKHEEKSEQFELIAVAFRGDARDFNKVKDHKGTRAKVLVEDDIDNLKAPWNPFNFTPEKDNMYFRRGANDNCIYSVVSIGGNYPLPLGFPLIEDKAIYKYPLNWKNFKGWSDIEKQTAKNSGIKIAKVEYLNDNGAGNFSHEQDLFIGTENYLYLSRLVNGDEFVNTQEVAENKFSHDKNSCKERGVREIPLEKLMVGIKVRRVHLGACRTDGTFGLVVERQYFFDEKWQAAKFVEDPQFWWKFNTFAQQHFWGNKQSAREFANYIKNTFKKGSFIEGECINDNNKKKAISIIDWLDPDDQKLQKQTDKLVALSNFSSMLGSSNKPVLLNGEKVIFDKAVATTPVTIEPKTTHR
ncbi:MAG: hypothetical protein F6J86_09060 [Symploca sp. SIO1B1]|nr:hypothetical protein [Symploca sp. SIO1B1]